MCHRVAWARKLDSGRWQGQYRDPSGRVRSAGRGQTFRLKSEALDAATALEHKRRARTYVDPSSSNIPFEDYFDRFLRSALELRPATRKLYRIEADLYVLPRIGSVPLGAIRAEDVRTLLTELVDEGVGTRTVQLVHQTISRTMRQAVNDELIEVNPAHRARPPKTQRKPTRILSPEQVAAIADAIDPRYRGMVLVAAWGGLRFGEAAALSLPRVRILERRIDVAEGLTMGPDGRIYIGPLKTAESRRTVSIPSFLAEALADHVATYPDPAGSEMLFTAPKGGPINRQSWRTRFWLPAVRQTGILPVPTFHHLRHHAAAVAIAAGAHPKAIQARLGHASITTTLNVYGHLFPGLDEELAERLEMAHADSAARLLQAEGSSVTPIRGKGA
jgi:integrase